METQKSHEDLIRGVALQFKAVLEQSGQGVYIYLDDVHKLCNNRFAALLGFKSPKEWSDVSGPVLDAFVEAGSQDALVTAFQNAVEHFQGSYLEVTWLKKDGSRVKTRVIMVPIVYDGTPMALHFVL